VAFENYASLVVRSRQLAPGVGGYRPEDLFSMYERVQKGASPFLISTACRCHGVVSGLAVD
jgi:hypothetical protein